MTKSNASGRTDRRIQRTYQQLTEAFYRLLLQKGWDQITVQDLCDEAVIRRTTFYQHFKDKQSFVSWCVKERLKEFSACIAEEDPPEDLGDHFELLSARVLDYMKQHDMFERIVMETGNRGLWLLESFLRLCVDEVVMRMNERLGLSQNGDTNVIPILSEFCVGGLLAALRWWYANGKPCTEEELIRNLRRIVERNAE